MCWEVSSMPKQKEWPTRNEDHGGTEQKGTCDMWHAITSLVNYWIRHICQCVRTPPRAFKKFSRVLWPSPLSLESQPIVQYKVPNLQLVMNYFLYSVPWVTSTWNSDMMWHPTPSPSESNQPPKHKYIHRLMDKIDSTLVPNFGYENTAISPDKQWRYVGLSLCPYPHRQY